MTTGILALQGDFREHEARLHQLGAPTRQVRTLQHLEGIERLIIPGGESTTIGKLLVQYAMLDAIRQRARDGMPIWGTCAGAILLAQRITDGKPEQPTLGLMDMVVRRNAYGRQLDSFETTLHLPALGETPVHGIFIRAPKIESVGETVDILGTLPAAGDETPGIIAAQQGRLLVTTFHPELTNDDRLHRYFLDV